MSSRKKEISIGKLIFKDGKYCYEVVQWLMVYDAVLNKWNKTNRRVIYKTIEENDGVSKSLTYQVIIKKPLMNTLEDEPQFILFLSKYIVEVPAEKKYTNYWLKKSGNHIVLSIVPKISYILSLGHEFFTQVGKPKRISLEKARALLESEQASLVEKYGGTYRTCTYFKVL